MTEEQDQALRRRYCVPCHSTWVGGEACPLCGVPRPFDERPGAMSEEQQHRPTVDDLRGSQPDITGGLDSVEFIRQQRRGGPTQADLLAYVEELHQRISRLEDVIRGAGAWLTGATPTE